MSMNVTGIREQLERFSPHQLESYLVVGSLHIEDLEHMSWCGDATHLVGIRKLLLNPGNALKLAIRVPSGEVVAKGLLEFPNADSGLIGQLATHPGLQSLGIGKVLMAAMEREIKSTGRSRAELGVELINHRAISLYEQLGYEHSHTEQHSWNATNKNGEVYLYETEVSQMQKLL